MEVFETHYVFNLLLVAVVVVGEEARDAKTSEIGAICRHIERTETEVETELTDSPIEDWIAIIDSHGLIGVVDDVLKASLKTESDLVSLVYPEFVGACGEELEIVSETSMVVHDDDTDAKVFHLVDLAVDIESASERRALEASPLRPEDTQSANDVAGAVVGGIQDTLVSDIVVEDGLVLRTGDVRKRQERGHSYDISAYSTHVTHDSRIQ